ncbi:MAG: cupin domain-containing protein [Bacteroidales bacterium]|jgi:mannose-6-phosphate isomerase-like protein (cupin superfamily)|nr:cupin domain-containing protein [Bacteroidales bacterium]MDY0196774.1 cupin domain-containing protein [Tenuifilaceae bacterium]
MNSQHLSTAPHKDTPHKVDVREMYNMPDAQVMHITLQPGEALKPHKTPVDVFFYILEGNPTIHIGDESKVFPKDSMIESPKDIVHYLSNESNSPARILVAKTPNPQGKRVL